MLNILSKLKNFILENDNDKDDIKIEDIEICLDIPSPYYSIIANRVLITNFNNIKELNNFNSKLINENDVKELLYSKSNIKFNIEIKKWFMYEDEVLDYKLEWEKFINNYQLLKIKLTKGKIKSYTKKLLYSHFLELTNIIKTVNN